MDSGDVDKLLEQGLSGEPPGQVFRAGVLQDSTAAFVHARRSCTRWRPVALSTAAVLIAAISFLCGRHSVPRPQAEPVPPQTRATADAGTVAVPSDLVAWLDAARLFRQLGMEDRMARAVDRAGRLLPVGAIAAYGGAAPAFAAGAEAVPNEATHVNPLAVTDLYLSFEGVNHILAQSFGE